MLLWVFASVAIIGALRVVDPPFSMVMLLEPGPLAAVDRRWADRGRISEAAALAVIAAEDQRFLTHDGIDFDALAVALREYRDGGPLRGASTITQQVAKNLFLWNGRSFARKGLEAWFALLIDLIWTKQRTLEVYLNVAELGPGVFGVEAASVAYFGHAAATLSAAEAATLAAVLPNPKQLSAARPGDYVQARRDEIVRQMRLLDQRGHYRGLDW